MNILSILFKSRDKPSNYAPGSTYSFFFGSTTSGKTVNERTALQTTAVYACVRILSETIASLPLHTFRYTDRGKEKALDHPLYYLLHNEPNSEMTSFVFRETLMSHLLLWGNAYAQIIRDGRGQILSLYPLLPDMMTVDRAANGEIIYQYRTDRGVYLLRREEYHYRDHHEAIISKEVFDAAQAIVVQRAKESGADKSPEKYKNRYPFSSKIICGHCDGTFKRQIQSHGNRPVSWCCHTHLTDVQKCSTKFILNADFEYAFMTMMNKLIFGNQAILKPLLTSLRSVKSEDGQASVQEIDQKLEENAEQQKVLVGLMTKGYLGPAIYRKSNNDLIQEAEHLKRYKESLINILDNGSQHIRKVGELLQFATKADMLTQFDGDLFSRFVKRIVVQSRTEISFELECGLTLSERLVR